MIAAAATIRRGVRFALVTPTLNAGELLRETVDSVVACLGPDDRYAIVDGGSTDGSVERVAASLPTNACLMRDGGGGMYDAIACGFAAIGGELMGWLNASDVLLRGALDVVRRAFAETGAELVHFDDLVIDAGGLVQRRTSGSVPDPEEAMRTIGWTPLQDGCFWTRELYERCGGIDRSWKLAGDFDFFLRAFHAGRTAHVPGVVSAFRLHEGQLSHTRRRGYRDENRGVRQRFASEHPALRAGPLTALRRRVELTWRARSGRGAADTPFVGRHWSTVSATLA